jgi:hypothetical protein
MADKEPSMRIRTANRRRARSERLARQRRERVLAMLMRELFRKLGEAALKAMMSQAALGQSIRGLADQPIPQFAKGREP